MENYAVDIEGYGKVTLANMIELEKSINQGKVSWNTISSLVEHLERCFQRSMTLVRKHATSSFLF